MFFTSFICLQRSFSIVQIFKEKEPPETREFRETFSAIGIKTVYQVCN